MTYKAVILGCGPRAASHLDAYKENLPEIELAAACDADETRRLDYGKKYAIPRLYVDFETMLKTEKPDILHVVTPPAFREQALELAGKYGVKGVLMEKPLALTVTQAERVRAVAEKYHLKVAINMQRRYFDHCRALREVIRSNQLGTIEFVRCIMRGNILSMGPHAIDLTLFLLDNPPLQKIWATGYAMNGHEYGHPAPAHILGRINFAPNLTVYLEDADDAVGVFGETGGYWQHLELDIWGGRGRAWWNLRQLGRIFKSPAMLMKTYRELEKLKKEQRAKLLKRFSELKTEQDEVGKQLRAGGDIAILTPRYTELANALDEVKRELESIGEIYSTDNLAEACGSIEAVWEELFPVERYKLAHLLIDRITLYKDRIIMDIKHHGLKSLIRDLKSEPEFTATVPEGKGTIQLTIPMLVKRWNGRKIILAPGETETVEPEKDESNAMAKKLAQAYRFMGMIEAGKYSTRTRLAEDLNLDQSMVVKTLNLLNLSPKIQKMIVENKMPDGMTLERLYGNIPFEWEEQEQMFLPQLIQ
ncbi:MAG: Gfo/Idh/MocA family oxidoreductase [Victivallaceae bacterium]|nr:Gfo/Idh/MocA family oxidoreductase [Victivallaceae bacterium]